MAPEKQSKTTTKFGADCKMSNQNEIDLNKANQKKKNGSSNLIGPKISSWSSFRKPKFWFTCLHLLSFVQSNYVCFHFFLVCSWWVLWPIFVSINEIARFDENWCFVPHFNFQFSKFHIHELQLRRNGN